MISELKSVDKFNKNWLPMFLEGSKTNSRPKIHCQSSTNTTNLVKIGQVTGLKGIIKNKKQQQNT